ncbi:MAG: sugar phosphate isomerase/epimerase [Planctomycetota bacterium]|nr:MAG: sugar phosphate isomerase/epimerase [Planctomycetota bacterium]
MKPTRREMLSGTAAMLAGITVGRQLAGAVADLRKAGVKVSMYDASMGYRSDKKAFARAKEIGLDGVQVNFCLYNRPFDIKLRKPEVQKEILSEARKHKIAINSVALGVLNVEPLKSEPRAAVWMVEALEIAKVFGAKNIMPAFFGRGELKWDNKKDIQRVTDVLKDLAPRAEKAGVIIGLENTLEAEQNLKIIEEVGSRFVQSYYDVFNMVGLDEDPIKAIKLLGKKNICEFHFKEGGHYLGQSGRIPWKQVAATIKEIGYQGWITLETSNPSRDVIADTKRNVKFVRGLFAGA